MKIIEMSERMSRCEIAKELGILSYSILVIKKKYANVGSILDRKNRARPSKLNKKISKKTKLDYQYPT